MPLITEEIYQNYFGKSENEKSIHLSAWPEGKKSSPKYFAEFCELLSKIRQEKTKAQKSMNSEIILSIEKDYTISLKDSLEDLKRVTNAKEIKEGKFKVEFV